VVHAVATLVTSATGDEGASQHMPAYQTSVWHADRFRDARATFGTRRAAAIANALSLADVPEQASATCDHERSPRGVQSAIPWTGQP